MDLNTLIAMWNDLGLLAKIVGILLIAHPIASMIVAATPTPADDSIYANFYRYFLEPMSLTVFKAKDTGEKKADDEVAA